jgi:hypothetical protein
VRETKIPSDSSRPRGEWRRALPIPLASRDAGNQAEVGILASEPSAARLQLRDSAGLAPDFPRFSLAPSDETLCCAFGCWGGRYHGAVLAASRAGRAALLHLSLNTNGCSFWRCRMPLKIEMSPESVRPVVVCDGCGEPIADARDGNYQWQAPLDPGMTRKFVFFTHKATQPRFRPVGLPPATVPGAS